MPNDLLGQIHSSTDTTSSDWATFRGEVTGMYLLSGQGGEWDSQHLIREYNRNINSLYKSWTPTEPNATGLFLEPYNAGFSYQGTGDFRDYKWDTYSVVFDGADDYVDTNYQPDFINTNATMCFWCKMDNFNGDQLCGASNSHRFYCGFNGTNAKFGVQDSFKRTTDISAYVSVDTWLHICLVADGGTASYYIDGVSRDTMSYTQDAATNPDTNILIGAISHPHATQFLDGKIDEVAIFDRALSAAQVLAIYNGGTPQSLAPYSPTAWWRMGDGPLDDGNRSDNGLIGDQVNPTLGSETITNGTFETNLDNWTESTTPTLVTWERNTTSPIAGDADAHAVGNASSNFAGVASNGISLVDGKTYKVTFKYRKSGTVKLKIGQSTNPSASKVSGTTEPTLTATTNDTFTYYFRPTQTVTGYVIFYLYIDAELYVDDVSLKEVNGNAGLMENMTASDIVADTP